MMTPAEKARKTTLERHGKDFYKKRAEKAGRAGKSWWDGDSKKASELAKLSWQKRRESIEGELNADSM